MWGADRAVIVGHDWGALVARHTGMLDPQRCRAIVAANVPYHRWPTRPTEVLACFTETLLLHPLFQAIGVAEHELDDAVERFLLSIVWSAACGSAGTTLASDLPFEAPP